MVIQKVYKIFERILIFKWSVMRGVVDVTIRNYICESFELYLWRMIYLTLFEERDVDDMT